MLIEHRTYTTRTEHMRAFAERYVAEGLPIQRPVLGDLMGMFSTEVGPQEQVILIWRYLDFADRAARRARLHEIPEWKAFVRSTAHMVVAHENRLLNPLVDL